MNTPPYDNGDEVPPEQEDADLRDDLPWALLLLLIFLFTVFILWRAAR